MLQWQGPKSTPISEVMAEGKEVLGKAWICEISKRCRMEGESKGYPWWHEEPWAVGEVLFYPSASLVLIPSPSLKEETGLCKVGLTGPKHATLPETIEIFTGTNVWGLWSKGSSGGGHCEPGTVRNPSWWFWWSVGIRTKKVLRDGKYWHPLGPRGNSIKC